MNITEQLITICMIALATIITRFIPFLIFKENNTPSYIHYLGKVLPAAVFSLLVVYCLKNVSLISSPFALPELISIAVIVVVHLWKKQTLLSVASGTICYMILVQQVFV